MTRRSNMDLFVAVMLLLLIILTIATEVDNRRR